MSARDEFNSARTSIFDALKAEMACRAARPGLSWIDHERFAVVRAANEWATAHGRSTITVDQVEAIEGRAVGHVDYASKLALYVAELVLVP